MITFNQAKEGNINILPEEFAGSDWSNYVTYDSGQLYKLQNQNHRNIRSFTTKKSRYLNMFEINALGQIGDVSASPVNGWSDNYFISDLSVSTQGETWSAGTIGPILEQNNVSGLTVNLSGTTPQTIISSTDSSINLSNFYTYSYSIVFSLPDYPSSNLTTTVTFASSSGVTSGPFTISQSSNSIPLSSISSAVLQDLKTISFTLTPTSSCTFKCTNIRCLSNNYVDPPLDFNNQNYRLVRPPSKSGQLVSYSGWAASDATNTTTAKAMQQIWPPMLKSFAGVTTSGSSATIGDSNNDPRPVNVNASVLFNSGSMISPNSEVQRSISGFSSSNYLTISNGNSALSFSNAFTIETWFKYTDPDPSHLTANKPILAIPGSSGAFDSNGAIILYLNGSAGEKGITLKYFYSTGSKTVSTTTKVGTFGDDNYHHLVATYDGTADSSNPTLKIYLDGSLEKTVTTTGGGNGIGSQSITAAARIGSDGTNFAGSSMHIYNLSVYNSVLTLSQIQNHKNVWATNKTLYPYLVLRDNPVAFWKFNESASPFLNSATASPSAASANSIGTITSTTEYDTIEYNQIGLILRETGDQPYTQYDLTTTGTNGGASNKSQADVESLANVNIKSSTANNRDNSLFYLSSLKWNKRNVYITFEDESNTVSSGLGLYYQLAVPNLSANTNYQLNVSLENNRFRVTIYQLNDQYLVTPSAQNNNYLSQTVFYDSNWVVDDRIRRRKGRFGWWANLYDGDAYIRKIGTNSITYGEYVSSPMKSKTPVSGVQIFAENSPYRERINSIYQYGSGATLTTDSNLQKSVVNTSSSGGYQGFVTNEIVIDTSRAEINFNIFSSNIDGISAYLLSTDADIERRIDLTLPNLISDQTNNISIPINGLEYGKYRLYIVQYNTSNNVITLSNLSFANPRVEWYSKANEIDSWKNYNLKNNALDVGMSFDIRGSDLRTRASAKDQFASIHKIKTIPKYATLGALDWTGTNSLTTDITDIRTKQKSINFFVGKSSDENLENVSLSSANPSFVLTKTITYTRSATFVNSDTVPTDWVTESGWPNNDTTNKIDVNNDIEILNQSSTVTSASGNRDSPAVAWRLPGYLPIPEWPPSYLKTIVTGAFTKGVTHRASIDVKLDSLSSSAIDIQFGAIGSGDYATRTITSADNNGSSWLTVTIEWIPKSNFDNNLVEFKIVRNSSLYNHTWDTMWWSLSSNIGATTTSISILNDINPPSSGEIQVDAEFIKYSSFSGTSPYYTLSNLTRGSRYTNATSHLTSSAVIFASTYYFDNLVLQKYVNGSWVNGSTPTDDSTITTLKLNKTANLLTSGSDVLALQSGTNYQFYASFGINAKGTAITVSGNSSITLASTTQGQFIVGQVISGANIPVNTVIKAISGTTITMSNPATSSTTINITANASQEATYRWVFDDGFVAEGQLVNHTFASGPYNVNYRLRSVTLMVYADGQYVDSVTRRFYLYQA